MKLVVFILALIVILEFRKEVHGEPTLIGCFIRGLDEIYDGLCTGQERDDDR